MTIYVSLLPPPNRPILNHDDHFSFTYAFQLDHQSPLSKVSDHFPPSPAASFPAGPRRLLESDGQDIMPSSPSWTAVATLLSQVKTSHNVSLHDDTLQWCPEFLAGVRVWTPLNDEDDLIRRVLHAARETLTRKKPSSLCVKIRKVVTLSEEEFKRMAAERKRKRVEDDVFQCIVELMNRMKLRGFEELFSEDIEAARACWSGLSRRMGWDAVLGRERAGSVLGRVRVWELKSRVVNSLNWVEVEPENDEEEECCSICLEGGGGKYRLPCAHTYHLDCIFKWMSHKQNCPTCRIQL